MKVVVEHNPLKKDAVALSKEVVKFLLNNKVDVIQGSEYVSTSKDQPADLLIVIGGDGTVLYHKEKHPSLPIFGIGSATSFLCQASKHDWVEKLQSILKHGFTIEKRSMVDIIYHGKLISTVLNEGLIRQTEPRIIFFEVKLIDNEVVANYKFRADGFIISSPTGSSGHTYSCFAEEISEESNKLVLAAVSPYRRAFLPLYIPNSYSVSVVVELSYTGAQVVCDGMSVFNLVNGDEVFFRKSKRTQGFVRSIV